MNYFVCMLYVQYDFFAIIVPAGDLYIDRDLHCLYLLKIWTLTSDKKYFLCLL